MHIHIGCICLTFLQCELSNVSSKRVHKRLQSHTGCICLSFPHCALSNAFSNCLHERMHNCTACLQMCPQMACIRGCIITLVSWPGFICSTFNVCFQMFPLRMLSHTGCICLTFLHCAFSNVSLNCLHKRMRNYTDSICLTFLHCVFSNVSSSCLPLRM